MKNFFDLSKGVFHSGVAHLYLLLTALLSLLNMIFIASTRPIGPISIAMMNVVIIPIIVSALLACFAIHKKNKLYRIYSLFTIGYILVVIAVVTGIRTTLRIEAVQMFFKYNAVFTPTQTNILPGIIFILSLVVIVTIVSIITTVIGLYLASKDIKPKPKKVIPVVVTPDVLADEEN